MEEEVNIRITTQLEDVPIELIHHIQSLLPAKAATSTCVLSKSWLHAWSTIPTLRFTTCVPGEHVTEEEEIDYIKLIDRTLLRYLNNNMPIECLHIHLDICNSSFSSLAEKWFKSLAFTNCLKELSLTICGKRTAWHYMFPKCLTIPGEIFSCENLNTISLTVDHSSRYHVMVNMNLVMIKCSFLQILELVNVGISSEDALNNLLCSCSLLEKINILFHQDIKLIKVKNLRCLHELKITLVDAKIDHILEIYDVPSLHVFYHHATPKWTFKMDSLGSVRELVIIRIVVDDQFTDMINSKFPFLESLKLTMLECRLETIDITCDSLKRLTLKLWEKKQIKIQIYASKLLYFSYEGLTMPNLLFPTNAPECITLILNFNQSNRIDLSFFLKMREALSVSSNFDIEIINFYVSSNIDLDDIRRRVLSFPARNVQQLSFTRSSDIHMWEHSTLFELFFSICYPRYVKAHYWPVKNFRPFICNNYSYKQMVRRIMVKKRLELKDVEIKDHLNGKWETLTNFQRSFHEEANDYNSDEFKLIWCS